MKRRSVFAAILILFLFAAMSALGSSAPLAQPAASSTPTNSTQTPSATVTPQAGGGLGLTTPTPRPTFAPGKITDLVESAVAAAGFENTNILGLPPDDWINLGISILIALFGVLIASPLLLRLIQQFTLRTPVEIDETLFQDLKPQLRWFFGVLFIQFATTRLVFLSLAVKTFLGYFYFIAYLLIILSGLWKLADYTIDQSIIGLFPEDELKQLKPLAPLIHRLAHILLLIFGAHVLLGRFGIELTTMATALGIGGLAISLAAQDVLSDLIAGFIILISQPFRVGDRIEIQDLGTWGDVVSIGARATNIRTRDNRMVIVPNSIIGKGQVVNYTYPDPQYRVQMEIGIAYGTDIEAARRIIIDTVGQVEGVLKDKPVDALYIAMGDSAMTFRIRWWIASYVDTRRVFDRVNTALQTTLDAAGIEMPFPTQALNVRIEPEPERSDNQASVLQ